MNQIYFIADTHFGDDALRRYENRPFETTEEMDAAMIAGWNKTVDAQDTIYHLGDFGAAGREAEIVRQLSGRILLVKGNHDKQSNEYYRQAGFAEVYDLPVLFENFWLLSHEPLYVNANMPYANLFGHVHASPLYKDYSSQHYCVSVERIGYQPVAFETIKETVAKQSLS